MEKFTFEPLQDIHTEEIKKNSVGSKLSNPEMAIYPSGCVLPKAFRADFERIYNFEVYPDDTWIITYPKCGTTWTQEMVWLLINKLDYETAKTQNLRMRCPFIELQSIISGNESELQDIWKSIDAAASLKRPRCIKSHLPVELLPKALWEIKPKIVYVTRDPRDVSISYFHHYRLWNGYKGQLKDFTEAFIADRLVYSPFWSHIMGFWNLKDKSHVCYNSFEEMKQDLSGVIRKTAKFLNVEITDNEVEELKDHLSFNKMKQNNSVNYSDVVDLAKKDASNTDSSLVFIRKGETGEWKSVHSKEIIEKFKKWTQKALTGTQFTDYPFSLK